ncbi:MAG TPA: prephenate dehydrogenase [Arachnia sp.]|nr:prephenate dehydrogenase [Arachnia sp.]
MGLRYLDHESWRRWQESRRRLQILRSWLASPSSPTGKPDRPHRVWARGSDPALLVACDSNSPTNHHALLAPLSSDVELPAIVVYPTATDLRLPGDGWREVVDPDQVLAGVRAVVSIGDHLGVGAWAHEQAARRGWRQLVVQHGLLTPFSPPPPPDVEVLAWSEADAAFITAGRPDLTTHVVGSPLLAAAAGNPARHVSRFATPVFLGQLHGAELSRWSMTRSVTYFWRLTGATYRPHPREEDKLSQAQHAIWRRLGMDVDSSTPLAELDRPVVSAFSTGVLEAAARGIPAWVFHVSPPPWLEEFWDRYSMSRWGRRPTPPPAVESDPATRIAHHLAEAQA